ncbi:DUF1631 domain-containing protein [Aestuariicella hydrocarbonica]|uniref:DUF1631 domain-containing protein n=1 Tax=Pseudomaricurvus hydrocarbonicus TaxID=1470433 RepID=A0A9E5JT64_9GAMM|nr:DUF1631 domain-containing protein [Aestuariicella hydrocarbonica]NHO65113.1 DUF1631 domain-containing protein [Aestuariicella hydrocarbonica]
MRSAQVSLARLPAPVHRVREKATALLQQTLTSLFSGADDALFDLADKATSNQDQNIYFEAMREVRLKRRETEQHFFAQLDRAYTALSRAIPEEAADTSLATNDLKLVDNTLEFQVAVESMTAKALTSCAEGAQHIALRLNSLVPAKVYQMNNPVGPDVLCKSFLSVIEPLEVDIKAKLVLLKLFDKAVMAQLSKIYQILNSVLIQQNVLPSLAIHDSSQQRQTNTSAQRSASANGQQGAGTAQTAAVQAPVLEQLRGLLTPGESEMPAQAGGGVAALNKTAGPQVPAGDAAVGAPSSSGATGVEGEPLALSVTELAELLTALQYQPMTNSGAQHLLDATQLTQLLQRSAKAKTCVSSEDQDVMNLIYMLFQFILDDRSLATSMQRQLARLQIPLLKVAIVDKSFFIRAGHPARRLLNELATAALGWQEPDKGIQEDPLFKKVVSIIEVVIADFEDDAAIFDALLTDFLAFTEKERRRADVLEKRTVDAEGGKAKSEFVRSQVSEQIDAIVQGRELPACVSIILDGPWHNVMFITLLKCGSDTEAWQAVSQVVDDLVWSVTAILDAPARKRFMGMLPGLLKNLRKGFEEISYNPLEMNKLLQQLEAEHLRRMRAPLGQPPVASAIDVAAPDARHAAGKAGDPGSIDPVNAGFSVASPVTDKPELRSSEPPERKAGGPGRGDSKPAQPTRPEKSVIMDGDGSKSSQPDSEVSAAWLGQVDRFAQGAWFEVAEPGQPVFRCRLAAVMKAVDKFIFVNRSGMKVAEKSRKELARALETKVFRALDDGMLFDRALESVIGNLRETRSK